MAKTTIYCYVCGKPQELPLAYEFEDYWIKFLCLECSEEKRDMEIMIKD